MCYLDRLDVNIVIVTINRCTSRWDGINERLWSIYRIQSLRKDVVINIGNHQR